MIYAQIRICLRNGNTWNSLGFWDTIRSPNPDLLLINKKKRTCQLEDFAILADNRVKIKD